MVLHDLSCEWCDREEVDAVVDPQRLPACSGCGGPMEIRYDLTRRGVNFAAVHPSERAVVWRDPKTGHVAYPGRNDAPMPERYRQRGFERVEMSTLKQLDRFSKEQGVVNEKANFNNGNEMDDGMRDW